MSRYDEEFFENKRSWSHIKDTILGAYMPAYTAKLNMRGQRLLLIDAFAGPGRFEDGKAGLPLLICNSAEKYAKDNYTAIFLNKNKKYHQHLDSILKNGGYFPQATAVHADSNEWLQDIAPLLDQPYSIFLYLDPYGLSVPFDTVSQFLNRPTRYSTEILVNLCVPILHRLAGRNADDLDKDTVEKRHAKLTQILGGDYWKEALLTEDLLTKKREEMVVKGYLDRLSENGYLKYKGYCPIQATRDGRTKYFMLFATSHIDGMKVMNDNMIKAFESFMSEQENANTLFSDSTWRDWRDTREIEKVILEYIAKHPGKMRKDLWSAILLEHFFKFTGSEFLAVTKKLLNDGRITSPTIRTSPKLLNDECILYVV